MLSVAFVPTLKVRSVPGWPVFSQDSAEEAAAAASPRHGTCFQLLQWSSSFPLHHTVAFNSVSILLQH